MRIVETNKHLKKGACIESNNKVYFLKLEATISSFVPYDQS